MAQHSPPTDTRGDSVERSGRGRQVITSPIQLRQQKIRGSHSDRAVTRIGTHRCERCRKTHERGAEPVASLRGAKSHIHPSITLQAHTHTRTHTFDTRILRQLSSAVRRGRVTRLGGILTHTHTHSSHTHTYLAVTAVTAVTASDSRGKGSRQVRGPKQRSTYTRHNRRDVCRSEQEEGDTREEASEAEAGEREG
jgi:hypothetical protein